MSQDRISISADLRGQLRRAVDAALPGECCGVLLGDGELGRLFVRRVLSTLNTSNTVGTFSIPDQEMRRVRSLAVQFREPIIAIFHSHPDGCSELSEPDRRALAYSEWPWVVVTPTARAGDVELRRHDIST
jgi:proteasome lid subunit RPN8/RPN11